MRQTCQGTAEKIFRREAPARIKRIRSGTIGAWTGAGAATTAGTGGAAAAGVVEGAQVPLAEGAQPAPRQRVLRVPLELHRPAVADGRDEAARRGEIGRERILNGLAWDHQAEHLLAAYGRALER